MKGIKELLNIKARPNSIVIYPEDDGGIKFEKVSDPHGIPWRYKGRPYYLLAKNKDSLIPYEPPDKMGIMLPGKLYRARKCESARRLLQQRNSLMEKMAIWACIAALGIGGLLIIIMMDMI